ncbi:MAG: hypothetical protein NTY59_08050 [Alphaproteobacteria bacterium]|nr:hypothetical protein [Alphaproteobacteria bacterium]
MSESVEPLAETTAPTAETAVHWTGTLAPELKALAAHKGWRGPEDALRSYAHLERAFGADKVALPGKDAKPEDWDALYTRLGRPTAPEQYDLADVARPDGMPWNAEGERAMLREMHAAGLSNRQARHLLSKYAEMQGGAWSTAASHGARRVEDAQTALRRDWGAAFDAKSDLANRAFRLAFGDGLDEARQLRLADSSFLGDHPSLVRAFARLGESLAEHPMAGAKGGAHLSATPEEARAEIARMHGEPATMRALTDRAHPEYAVMVAKRDRLYRLAYPE